MHKDDPLQIEIREGKDPGIRIFILAGPVTMPNLFKFQDEMRRGGPPRVAILDLAGVPYMDSAGMGVVVNFYTHCERNGGKMLVAGVSARVAELFKLTRVDTIIPMVGSIEEAEARAGGA